MEWGGTAESCAAAGTTDQPCSWNHAGEADDSLCCKDGSAKCGATADGDEIKGMGEK